MIGILFDFNGTMFFDESFQEESWESFLMKKTGRAVTEKEFQKYIHGRNSDFSLPYFLGRPMSRGEIELLEEEKESIYSQHPQIPAVPLRQTPFQPVTRWPGVTSQRPLKCQQVA